MTAKQDIPLEHIRLLFEASPGAFLILLPDTHFTIVEVTDSYLRQTLAQREHIIGKPVFEAFPDNPHTPDADSTKNLQASLERVVATGMPDTMAIQRYDVPKRDGSGFELRYWSPVNTPALSSGGELLYIIHRVENVTDYILLTEENKARQRQSEELSARNRWMEAEIVMRSRELDVKNAELRQANAELAQYVDQARTEAQRKDEFLAMLAHELRNPLASITTALELLEIVGDEPAKAARLRETCHRQLGNLTRLVDDLLDASRVSRGTIQLRMEALDVRDVLESGLHAMRGIFDSRGLTISTSIDAGSYRMTGDATRLEQVVTNLLANAAKFTEAGGRVDIALRTERKTAEPCAVLEIKDTGRGIAQEKLGVIFDMFVQADAEIDRSRGGLGIGLTVVQKLVEAHGGCVAAYSAGPGLGSTFAVRLPLAAGIAGPVPGDRGAAAGLVATNGEKLLLIEDNADAREMLKSLLEAFGYAVEVAATGEEGLHGLAGCRPDIAVVDIGLPGLDGFEVARRARALPGADALTLIALSGYGGREVEQKALAAGFDLHLVKPVSVAALTRALQLRSDA